MVDLIVVAEGTTEEGFVTDVLAEHLCPRFNVLATPSKVRTSVSHGRVHRGGGNSWGQWEKEIRLHLGSTRASRRVTTLVDLYKLPSDWPGNDDASRRKPPFERVYALEQAAYDVIGDRRFIPFVMLYEYETIFFADLEKLMLRYPDAKDAVAAIRNDLRDTNASCVEWINDNPATAPSKRIIRHVPEYEREKASAGPVIAASVGLATICRSCPHFSSWLRVIESLDPRNPTHTWPVVTALPGPNSAEP